MTLLLGMSRHDCVLKESPGRDQQVFGGSEVADIFKGKDSRIGVKISLSAAFAPGHVETHVKCTLEE
jgi:hypothetical protein